MADDPRDLGRWLAAVRPADRDWDRTGALVGVRRRTSARRRRAPFVAVPAVGLGALAVAVAAVLTVHALAPVGPSRVGAGRAAPAAATGPRPALQALHRVDTCPALLTELRTATEARIGPYGLPPGAVTAVTPATFGSTAAGPLSSAAGAATSSTNVQEPGVDEPDVAKTDGDRVVTVTDGVLHVLDAGTRAVTGTLDLTAYANAAQAQLLVSGDRAVVLLAAADGQPGGYVGAGVEPVRTTVLYVDLAGAPTVTSTLRVDGSAVAARMVGSTVRLVEASSPLVAFPQTTGTDAQRTAANRAVVAAAPISAWLPSWTVTGAGAGSGTVPCPSVSLPSTYTGLSFVSVYTLDPAAAGDPTPVTVAADGDTVYATATSLYVTATPATGSVAGLVAEPAAPATTEVHRFDISGSGPPAYLGSARVDGRPLSSYSLSDYDGYLRIATTDPTGTSSSIVVLDDRTLGRVGAVTGLGKGERLYAVRFLGPTAYVVTFRNTDPLYVVDLSTPAAPRVAGSLQLTGYSTYLHDAGDGRVIGVGQEASASGVVAGTQVSLFDVRDTEAPTRTGHVVVPGALGEGTLDPHAFLYWQPTGLVVVPEQSWDQALTGRVLVLHVAGASLTEVGEVQDPPAADGLGIQRTLLVDGTIWTVSGSGVGVSDPATLHRLAWVPFS